MLFVALIAMSALVSTLDLVYDRHLSTNRDLVAAFFAVNLFACLTAAVPIVWRVGPTLALRISAGLAFVGFASFYLGRRVGAEAKPWIGMLAVALVLALAITLRPAADSAGPAASVVGRLRRRRAAANPADESTIRSRARRLVGDARRRDRNQRADGADGIGPPSVADQRRHRAHDECAPRERRTQGRVPSLDRAADRQRAGGGAISVDVETDAGQLIGRATIRVTR